MLKLTIQSVILALVVIFGLKAYAAKAAAQHEYSVAVTNNINALSEPTIPGEGGEGGGVTPTDPEGGNRPGTGSGTELLPPDPWNFVPGRFIEAEVKTFDLICTKDGEFSIQGFTISGKFSKGDKCSAVVEIKNCSGKKDGAWCDQRQVGSRLLSYTIEEKL